MEAFSSAWCTTLPRRLVASILSLGMVMGSLRRPSQCQVLSMGHIGMQAVQWGHTSVWKQEDCFASMMSLTYCWCSLFVQFALRAKVDKTLDARCTPYPSFSMRRQKVWAWHVH
eukprot:5480576-Amphidinium_carterae.1